MNTNFITMESERQFLKNREKNIIDKQVLDAMKPLIFTQNFLLFPKFIITERNITKLKKLCIRSLLGLVLYLLMRVFRTTCLIYVFTDIYIGVNSLILLLLNASVGFVGTICSYIVNIAQSQNSIKILVELQYALRSIYPERLQLLASLKLWNNINVICLFIWHVVYTILIGIVNQEHYNGFYGTSFFVSYVVAIIFDLNVILATRAVDFIAGMLAAWNRRMFPKVAFDSDEDSVEVMFCSYKRMIKAFNISENVYQFAIFYHTCQTFHHVLYSMQLLLEYFKSATKDNYKFFGLLRGVVYFLWNCKNFALLINLSVATERFYAHIGAIQEACAKVVADCKEPDMRRSCKNVLRVNRAALRRLSPFGLFSVDAAFPLRLICALVPYIVVLLQFALL